MKYNAMWRTYMVALAISAIYFVLCYWWTKDTFPIISHSTTDFLIKWWWLIAIALFATLSTLGFVLILFGERPRFLIRLLIAVIGGYLFPYPLIAVIYWIVFVERFRPNNSFKPSPLRGLDKGR